jgi:hypothetical protein
MSKKIKRTPEEWLKEKIFSGYTIMDPDGWDRSGFEIDWKRRITEGEMWTKLMQSSVIGKINAK